MHAPFGKRTTEKDLHHRHLAGAPLHAEGGPGKRTGSNPDTAPRSDPYIIGTDRSAIGTLVERRTRFTMLLHLPRLAGWGVEARVKNGPALAGHGAVAMRSVIAAQMTTMPDQLRRSLTWDRGKELAQHAQLKIDTGIASTSPTRTRPGREH